MFLDTQPRTSLSVALHPRRFTATTPIPVTLSDNGIQTSLPATCHWPHPPQSRSGTTTGLRQATLDLAVECHHCCQPGSISSPLQSTAGPGAPRSGRCECLHCPAQGQCCSQGVLPGTSRFCQQWHTASCQWLQSSQWPTACPCMPWWHMG